MVQGLVERAQEVQQQPGIGVEMRSAAVKQEEGATATVVACSMIVAVALYYAGRQVMRGRSLCRHQQGSQGGKEVGEQEWIRGTELGAALQRLSPVWQRPCSRAMWRCFTFRSPATNATGWGSLHRSQAVPRSPPLPLLLPALPPPLLKPTRLPALATIREAAVAAAAAAGKTGLVVLGVGGPLGGRLLSACC